VKKRAAVVVCAALVCACYFWAVRAAGTPFHWGHELGGYYNYLGRAFAAGQLHVPIEPSPELLAQPNPWDPAVPGEYKMHDMALYNGRYYLYHGGAPALLLFAPWRLATGHDLPENFALALMCSAGFLLLCAALFRSLGGIPGAGTGALMALALGLCGSIPYLLNRVWVYEISIGGGFFCISAGLYFLARGWLTASGLMFGMAIACRPHLGIAGLVAVAVLRRRGLGFTAGFAAAGAAAALYNFLRFGDPLEFGLRYLLAGPDQNQLLPGWRNLRLGLYYFVVCPPEFGPVFPWVRLALREPFGPTPKPYFLEPIAGALWLAPMAIAAIIAPPKGNAARIAAAASALLLLFLAAIGFTTQRYLVDFLPMALFAGLVATGLRRRSWTTPALACAVTWGAVVNLALGIAGPYNEMAKRRPEAYARIAGWFSPIARHRPVAMPPVHVAFSAEFPRSETRAREPLVTFTGAGHWRYILVERLGARLRVISRGESGEAAMEIPHPGSRPVPMSVDYLPETRRLVVTADGARLEEEIGALVVAPSQIVIGENPIDWRVSGPRFSGRITYPVP
jgi:hypothetical protein